MSGFNTKEVACELPKHVTVSSIRMLNTCKRKYFYRYVRMLGNNYLYLPFYSGTIIHEGLQNFYNGASPKYVLAKAKIAIKAKTKQAMFRAEDEEKKLSQDALIVGALHGYMRRHAEEQKTWKTLSNEKVYRISLPNLKLKFRGALDLVYQEVTKRGETRTKIVDHKFQAGIYENMAKGIHQNMQLQLYPLLYEKCMGIRPSHGTFNVILKPKIRQKKDETYPEYVDRLKAQFIDREDDMFWRNTHTYKDRYLSSAFESLLITTEELQRLLHDAGDDFTNEKHWPKDTERCFDYFSTCPYFNVCKYGEYPQYTQYLGRATEYITGEIIDEPDIQERKNKTKKQWKNTKPNLGRNPLD